MPIRLNQLRDILQGLGYSASAMESSEPGLSIAMRMHGESRKVEVLPDQSGEHLHLRSLVSYCEESRPSLMGLALDCRECSVRRKRKHGKAMRKNARARLKCNSMMR